MVDNEDEFLSFGRQLLTKLTMSEHARASRIASQPDYNEQYAKIHPIVKSKLQKRQNPINSLIIHHKHENTFTHYKSTIHQKWNDAYRNTSIIETIQIIAKRCYEKVHITKPKHAIAVTTTITAHTIFGHLYQKRF